MTRASLPDRLAATQPLLGTFCVTAAVETVEVLVLAGFEVVVLDLEHGAFGIEAVPGLVAAVAGRGAYAVVRVRANEPSLIGAALDAGAGGVLVPQVDSAGAARAAVAAARYAPAGSRGANPYVRAAGYSGDSKVFDDANRTTAVMTMIEGVSGVDALDEIVATPHLTGVFVGPVDLSHALGVPGEPDHPRVVERTLEIVETADALGLATGVFAPSPEAVKRAVASGVRFVAYGVDTNLALTGIRRLVHEAMS